MEKKDIQTTGLRSGKLLSSIAGAPGAELFENLGGSGRTRIERIVSRGQASPAGFWYDQEEHEWVVLLAGRAALRFEGNAGILVLEEGDWVEIPAHRRHRVEWTAPDRTTIWLAVFYP